MRQLKYLGAGAGYTVALALPAALFAFALAVCFDRYFVEITRALDSALRAGWGTFFSSRWPEAVGMVVGQLLLMAVLLFGGVKASGNVAAAG